MPNSQFRQLKNHMNENKAVPNSRNGQEVPIGLGYRFLDFYKNYKHETWILDDYDHYEQKRKYQQQMD